MSQTQFPVINRRTLFLSSAAATLAAANGASAQAAEIATIPHKVDSRGHVGRYERLPRLDLESQQDYLEGFRIWVNNDVNAAAEKRMKSIVSAKGFDPDAEMPRDQALELLASDPVVTLRPAAWLQVQQLMWKTLHDHFHSMADKYLAELEAADHMGPGSLELNPDLKVPEYTTYEIHQQPGGYVGDPFAGYIYHYGTNEFYNGKNYQDETHKAMASHVPTPTDGKVQRILDMGCSCGQLATSLKERFPGAEVWGIDVGGPMVRYAHMRAIDIGADVHFAQRLAEDTKFPDNHFDLITAYILHHEVTADASKQIIKEAHRILRPGGVFYPIDFYTYRPAPRTAAERFRAHWTHRWNQEVWMLQYAGLNYNAEMRKVGFTVDENGPPAQPGTERNVVAIKQA